MKTMKYLTILLITLFFSSCSEDIVSSDDVIFSLDSISSVGEGKGFFETTIHQNMRITFSLKTNVPIPPEDSSSVGASIQIFCKNPYMMDVIFACCGNACNGSFYIYKLNPAGYDIKVQGYVGSYNEKYSITMYNIKIRY